MAFPPNQGIQRIGGNLFNARTNPQLYKRPDVEIKEIEVNLYLRVQ